MCPSLRHIALVLLLCQMQEALAQLPTAPPSKPTGTQTEPTYAAIAPQFFNRYQPLSTGSDRTLSIDFESTVFFRNTEFVGPEIDGRTSPGFFARPQLAYRAHDALRIRAGVQVIMYAGQEDFARVIPLFSLHFRLHRNLEVVAGHLYGSLHHGLEEPLFRFDRYYQDNVEYGFQLLWRSPHWRSDLWLNWEQFIEPGDPFQEIFTAGWSNDLRLGAKDGKHRALIPLRVLAHHRGGEINNGGSSSILTVFNFAAGLGWEWNTDGKLFRGLQVEQTFLPFTVPKNDQPGDPNYLPYNDGYGLLTSVNLGFRHANLELGYWYGDKFTALRGEYLYQSISEIDNSAVRRKNQMAIAKLSYSRRLFDVLQTHLEFDTYYDVDFEKMNWALTIVLNYDDSFLLKNFDKKR